MPDTSKENTGKVIVFRLQGGARNGQAIRSDQPQSVEETHALWALTWKGTVGRRFDVRSGDPAYQRYQVKSKYESGGEIHVTCEYVD